MTRYVTGIRIGRDAIERCEVLDEWQAMAKAIGAEWCEFTAGFLDGRHYLVVCDEEYHVRQEYRRGDPVTDFDNHEIFGTCLIFRTDRGGDTASLKEDEISLLLAKLPQCVRHIGEGSA